MKLLPVSNLRQVTAGWTNAVQVRSLTQTTDTCYLLFNMLSLRHRKNGQNEHNIKTKVIMIITNIFTFHYKSD